MGGKAQSGKEHRQQDHHHGRDERAVRNGAAGLEAALGPLVSDGYYDSFVSNGPDALFFLGTAELLSLTVEPTDIQLAEEPFAKVNLIAPQEYVGNIMDLCQQRRGEFKDMVYLDANRVELHYEMPLNEIIYDFFDALKSRTRGYGSLDYELIGYRPSRLVKLDILLNGEIVDALSFILFADNAYPRARKICEKLKDNIPRAQFEIPIQAAIGGKIIARETIKALRKDVLAKCYGGDITRKKKLLEKQKEGKKRMRQFGTVEVPQEAFTAVLKYDDNK